MKIAIIGAGLAGTSCAYVLKQYVSNVGIFEASNSLSFGASGNKIGLINPRISAFRTPESDYYSSAFMLAGRVLSAMNDVQWNQCGALHFITDDKREKRFFQTVDNWCWPETHMRVLQAEEASKVAGIPVQHDALYLPDSGVVSPERLCAAYAEGVDVHFKSEVSSLCDVDADYIILACGLGVKNFEETNWIPLSGVRGQVTQFTSDALSGLQCNLCYGGYCAPAIDGMHTVGATFQRWLDHTDILPEDDADNLQKLQDVLPSMPIVEGAKIVGHRASMRTASKDHFPIVGRVPGHERLFVSTGHGSHGIISAIAAAHVIADMILDRPQSQSIHTLNALSPARFENLKE